MTKTKELSLASPAYRQFIEELKGRVLSARISAARAVNRDLILLYWDIGRSIMEKQRVLDWGESVVEMISADLQRAFPQMTGFSPRNVWDMRRLYATYTEPAFLAQVKREMQQRKGSSILPQVVAEFSRNHKRPQTPSRLTDAKAITFLPQVVAEIPWGHHRLLLDKINEPAALW